MIIKKMNFFFGLSLSGLTKGLFTVFFALFVGYSYGQVEDNDADFAAQGLTAPPCSFDWNSCIELVSTDGCTHTFKISIESSDNFNNENITGLRLVYQKVGAGTIVSAEFENPNGEMATKGVTLNFGSNFLKVRYNGNNNNYLVSSEAILDNILVTVEGDLDNCFSMKRETAKIELLGSAMCQTSLGCAPVQVCTESTYVSGTVKAYPGTNCSDTQNLGIEGAQVQVYVFEEDVEEIGTTSQNGNYQVNLGCSGTPPYDVCVHSDCTSLCGLTTLDLVLIQKHILKMKEFDDCIQYIAADADENGAVDSNDVKFLRKIILGSLNPYDMCIFVPHDEFVLLSTCNDCQGFDLIDNCIEKDCNDCIEFYRVMRGDVNQTCEDCNMSQVQGIMSIDIASQNRGQTKVSLPVSDNINTFSIKINIGKDAYISNISDKLKGAEYTIENGVLSFIWLDLSKEMKGVKIEAGEPLFTIESADTKSISLSEEWDNIVFSDKGVMGIKVDDRVSKREVEPKHIVVGGSVFEVELPENTQEAYVELFDITGKLLYSNKHDLQNNNTYINNIPYVSGVYLLSIRTSSENIAKKIFLGDNR